MHRIYPGSIYYLEVVDRKLFAYQEKEVYQLEYSLGQFLDCFAEYGFVRNSKRWPSRLRLLYRLSPIYTRLPCLSYNRKRSCCTLTRIGANPA